MKKILLALFAMCSSIFAQAYDFTVDGIAYVITSLSDLECQVVKNDNPYEGVIVIPSEVQYRNKTLRVKSIGESAFTNATSLSEITLPSTTGFYLSDYCFCGCTQLKKVAFGDGPLAIGNSVFKGCTSLSSIKIPQSITAVGTSVFQDCKSLETMDLTGFPTVPSYMFCGCENLKDVTFGNSLKNIEEAAFKDCSSLEDIQLKDIALRSIGEEAFSGCRKMSMAIFGDSLLSIGSKAFADCGIEDFVVPNSVVSIGECIVSGENLKSVTIGNGVENLTCNPISSDANLTKLVFADGEKTMFIDQYEEGRGFTLLYESESGSSRDYYYYSKEGMFSSIKIDSVYVGRPIICTGHESSSRYSTIYEKCLPPFYNSPHIKSVTFSTKGYIKQFGLNGLYTDFWFGAFEGCTGLQRVTYLANSTVTQEGYSVVSRAFKGCTSLQDVKIEGALKWIDESMFAGCTALQYVYLGPNISAITINAFTDCNNISDLYCMATNPPRVKVDYYYDGVLFSKDTYLNCNLFVPEGALSTYQNTSPWSNFWNISTDVQNVSMTDAKADDVRVSIENGRITVGKEKDNQEIIVYNIQGDVVVKSRDRIIPVNGHGLYMVKVGNFTKKVCL